MTKTNKSSKPNSKKVFPPTPEFSRVVNVAQIPSRRSVLCRIVAKEKELKGLAERFDITDLSYFGANITLSRRDSNSIIVRGIFEAHMKLAELLNLEVMKEEFETLILDNTGGGQINFEENMDYDDEVGSSGSIDIGEISAQYFSLEM